MKRPTIPVIAFIVWCLFVAFLATEFAHSSFAQTCLIPHSAEKCKAFFR